MTEIPHNRHDAMLADSHDVLLVTNPVLTKRVKWLEIYGSEAKITYTVDDSCTVHAPINGVVSRIEPNTDGFGYIIEIKSDTVLVILTGFDKLLTDVGKHVVAGERIGGLRGIKPDETKDILFHIASKYEGIALNQILKIR